MTMETTIMEITTMEEETTTMDGEEAIITMVTIMEGTTTMVQEEALMTTVTTIMEEGTVQLNSSVKRGLPRHS